MEKQIFLASCPICGRSLFKGTPNSYIEGGCPKCSSFLQIQYTDMGVQTAVNSIHEKTKTECVPKR